MPPTEKMTVAEIQAKINFRVCNPTTASQYFHLLRSQVRRPFRKPLVVVSPKKLLKLRQAGSDIEEFGQGLRFLKVIDDQGQNMTTDDKIRRVVFCSGQVYYDLEAERQKKGVNDVAIVRIEQLAPFPFRSIGRILGRYKNAEAMWTQEEPKNQGPWPFVETRLRNLIKSINFKKSEIAYSGREISASTATGYGKNHTKELDQLV